MLPLTYMLTETLLPGNKLLVRDTCLVFTVGYLGNIITKLFI